MHPQLREHSSAGSEHLPYKQRVTGSNPVVPTTKSATYDENLSGFFLLVHMKVHIIDPEIKLLSQNFFKKKWGQEEFLGADFGGLK